MTNKLKVTKLALIAASMATLGSAYGADQFTWPADVQRPLPAYQGSAGAMNSPRQNVADRFTWPADVQRPLVTPADQGAAGGAYSTRQIDASRFTLPADVQRPL